MAATTTAMTLISAPAIAALLVGLTACFTDVRSRRIPNALTFGVAASALLLHGLTGGWSALVVAAAGWCVGAALFLPFFLLGGMGAGDVKLLAALGAILGPAQAFWLAIYTSLFGGVMAVVVGLATGYLGTAIGNVTALVSYWCLAGRQPDGALTLADAKTPRLAYAIPIFCGTAVTLWLH